MPAILGDVGCRHAPSSSAQGAVESMPIVATAVPKSPAEALGAPKADMPVLEKQGAETRKNRIHLHGARRTGTGRVYL